MEFSQNAFSAPTRTLTGLGTSMVSSTLAQTTIAAAASVDLRPAAGLVNQTTVSVKTGAAATQTISIVQYDGTNNYTLAITAAAANSFAGFTAISCNGVGLRLNNNDGANAGTYMFSTLQWVN